jgi:hypothetical protein
MEINFLEMLKNNSDISVSSLSIIEENSNKATKLTEKEAKLLNGIPTMPMGEDDEEDASEFICHKLGPCKSKSLRVTAKQKEKHMSHGNAEGLCSGDMDEGADPHKKEDCDGPEKRNKQGYYQYDKMCYDTREEKYLPC